MSIFISPIAITFRKTDKLARTSLSETRKLSMLTKANGLYMATTAS